MNGEARRGSAASKSSRRSRQRYGASASKYGDLESDGGYEMTGMGGGGGGGGGGYGVSAIELEKTLKKSLKAQRDTEVRLQLQLQKGVQLNGNTTRLLQENEMLKSQVRKPSPPSFAGPIRNFTLSSRIVCRGPSPARALRSVVNIRLGVACVCRWRTSVGGCSRRSFRMSS